MPHMTQALTLYMMMSIASCIEVDVPRFLSYIIYIIREGMSMMTEERRKMNAMMPSVKSRRQVRTGAKLSSDVFEHVCFMQRGPKRAREVIQFNDYITFKTSR